MPTETLGLVTHAETVPQVLWAAPADIEACGRGGFSGRREAGELSPPTAWAQLAQVRSFPPHSFPGIWAWPLQSTRRCLYQAEPNPCGKDCSG